VNKLQSASDSEELTASIFRVVKVECCKASDYAENVARKLLQNFSSLAISIAVFTHGPQGPGPRAAY